MMFKRWRSRARTLTDLSVNRLSRAQVHYIVENAAWSIRHDGLRITSSLPDMSGRITVRPDGIKNSIVHFGSINTWMNKDGVCRPVHPSNRTICTWFHIVPGEPRNKVVRAQQKIMNLWHCSCATTASGLIEMGVPEDRLVVIPLGVDTDAFHPLSDASERSSLRKELGIPEDRIVIGSFQKDGNGWGNGDTPKLIKGPDVLCDVLEQVATEIPLTVLLTGPARGYVKNRLKSAGVHYVHRNIPRAEDLAPFYRALDLYLITSRAEGGPKSLLESMASGVPVVTTAVGMAADIGRSEENVLMGPNEELTEHVLRLCRDPDLRSRLADAAYADIKRFAWPDIARRYQHELYERI